MIEIVPCDENGTLGQTSAGFMHAIGKGIPLDAALLDSVQRGGCTVRPDSILLSECRAGRVYGAGCRGGTDCGSDWEANRSGLPVKKRRRDLNKLYKEPALP